MSYADWEAQRGEVQIPRWMEKILRIPGGAFCLLLILLPFTLVRLVLVFTLSSACCSALGMLFVHGTFSQCTTQSPLRMDVMHRIAC